MSDLRDDVATTCGRSVAIETEHAVELLVLHRVLQRHVAVQWPLKPDPHHFYRAVSEVRVATTCGRSVAIETCYRSRGPAGCSCTLQRHVAVQWP